MKKYQLLEKAMQDYPAGTIASFMSAPNVDHISDGTFKIVKDAHNGVCVLNGKETECFYSSHKSGDYSPEWAVVHQKLTKTELLEKAIQDYPNGTRFKCASGALPNQTFISSGIPFFDTTGNIATKGCGFMIYSYGKWAEIIIEK